MAAPQVLSRKANGVPQSQASGDAPKPAKTKAPAEGDKVVIRRLPPGMTEDEFVGILGDPWRVGGGKVDWCQFHAGKVPKDASKPAKPALAYVHVMKKDDLMSLLEVVQTAEWKDDKDTWTNPSLVGPPIVEFSLYKKVPSNKKRTDTRQGTIDTDPEFMAFLESITNPAPPKETEGEPTLEETAKPEKTTTTPLIEYLKEKKANKSKEAAAAKSGKHSRQESQGGKGKGASGGSEESKKKSKDGKDSKESKAEKSSEKSKESVKILTKKAAAEVAAEAAKAVASQIQAGSQETSKSRRAGIAAAARILQRDLGLSPGNAHRKARQEAAKAEAEAKAAAAKDATTTVQEPASPSTTTETAPASAAPKNQAQQTQTSSSKSRGKKRATGEEASKGKADKSVDSSATPTPATKPTVILMKKKEAAPQASQSTSAQATPSSAPKPPTSSTTQPTPTGPKTASGKKGQAQKATSAPAAPAPQGTRAFIKHANPSQGVTEALLKEALQAFGPVTFVEIDRRKGFAYVDFSDHDGLVKAMAASPVSIAQATVQVLERKETGSKKAAAANARAAAAATAAGGGELTTAQPATQTAPAAPPAEKSSAGGTEKSGRRRPRGRGKGEKDGGAKEAGSGSAKADATARSAPSGSAPSASAG